MQIQLKQSEIVAALKQYITTQGINLAGKSVEISFTAGRNPAGIIADVSIEEAHIPGFSDSAVADEPVKPALSVVTGAATPAAETGTDGQATAETKPAGSLFGGA
jgi:hypothetical protein